VTAIGFSSFGCITDKHGGGAGSFLNVIFDLVARHKTLATKLRVGLLVAFVGIIAVLQMNAERRACSGRQRRRRSNGKARLVHRSDYASCLAGCGRVHRCLRRHKYGHTAWSRAACNVLPPAPDPAPANRFFVGAHGGRGFGVFRMRMEDGTSWIASFGSTRLSTGCRGLVNR